MKKLSTISILAAAATFALATSSFSGAVPSNGAPQPQQTRADAQTIADLQTAAKQALADGRNGGKNNLEYQRKNYEINLLIDRLQSGQQVDPAEIDKAMEPVHIW
jgi:outer membrane biogenesis lipoprotein LolB